MLDLPEDILDKIINNLDIVSLICVIATSLEFKKYTHLIHNHIYKHSLILKNKSKQVEYNNLNKFIEDLLVVEGDIYIKRNRSSLLIKRDDKNLYFKISNNIIYSSSKLKLKKNSKVSYLLLFIGLKIINNLQNTNINIPDELFKKLPEWFIHIMSNKYNGILLKELMCGHMIL